MKKIDLEAHYYAPETMRRWAARTEYPIFYPEENLLRLTEDFSLKHDYKIPHLYDNVEQKLEIMDENEFTMQVLSMSPGAEWLTREEAILECRANNDFAFAATQARPDRFKSFAILPVKDVEASVKELERCAGQLGFVGWMTFSNFGDTHVDDDCYFPIFEKAAELGVVIYLHPVHPSSGRVTGMGAQMLGSPFGYAIDTSITMMRLICKGIFDKLPDLKIILGHLGEVFPYILERTDARISKYHDISPAVNKQLPGYYFKNNIYITTSGMYSHAAFNCAKEVMGIDRILLGTDYPYEMMEDCNQFLKEVALSETDKEKLCYRNAEKLLGFTL
jgi:predicted TIM-barrel fold metal-dependent hydrolase